MADNIDIVVQEIGNDITVAVTYGDPTTAATIQAALGYVPADDADLAGKQDALGYTPEDIANKQTDLTSADAAHYPNVPAVNAGLTEAQTAVTGIDVKDYTGEAGTEHTYTIQTTDVGKTLRIQANLDDVITLEVGNDIDAAKPITIMKEFEGSVILEGTGTMILTGDDVDTNTMTYNTGTYETFQFIKLANNLIRVI